MKLTLPGELAAIIAREARASFPRECCGLIEGVWNADEVRAMALHPAPNRAEDANHFAIDLAAHLAAQKAARARGNRLIGCYHSHPGGPPRPSEADRLGAAEKHFVWLVAALEDTNAAPLLRTYIYSDEDFAEIGLATGADLVTSSSKVR